MKSVIEDLWYGNLVPADNCGADDPEIKDLIRLMERNKETLNQDLGQQQKILFEKYLDCTEEYVCLMSTRAFCDGFCLASRLMAETLLDSR